METVWRLSRVIWVHTSTTTEQKDAFLEDYWNVLKVVLPEARGRSFEWKKSPTRHKERSGNGNTSQ